MADWAIDDLCNAAAIDVMSRSIEWESDDLDLQRMEMEAMETLMSQRRSDSSCHPLAELSDFSDTHTTDTGTPSTDTHTSSEWTTSSQTSVSHPITHSHCATAATMKDKRKSNR